jgi:hypothetical protein
LRELRHATKLLFHAMNLYMMTCKLPPEDDWMPLLNEAKKIRARREAEGSSRRRNL